LREESSNLVKQEKYLVCYTCA